MYVVGNIACEATEEELKDLFGAVGHVNSFRYAFRYFILNLISSCDGLIADEMW